MGCSMAIWSSISVSVCWNLLEESSRNRAQWPSNPKIMGRVGNISNLVLCLASVALWLVVPWNPAFSQQGDPNAPPGDGSSVLDADGAAESDGKQSMLP